MIFEHPNRRAFTGVLFRVDEPSDNSPSGARGRKLIIPTRVAEGALHSLIGMAVNWEKNLERHEVKKIGGIITEAKIEGRDVRVGGFLFPKNLQREVEMLERDDLGMSFEAADCMVENMKAKVWTIIRLTFTGATVIQRNRAAYKKSSFSLRPDSGVVPLDLAAQTSSVVSGV